MDIKIRNCNNIDIAKVLIVENKLNIKYAINGSGKSTISQAILYRINDLESGRNSLELLKPFKYLGSDDSNPEVLGIETIKNVKVFDEDYVNNFVFLPDELVKNSFDIFIHDQEYENGIKEIDSLIKVLKENIAADEEIDELIQDLGELSDSFGRETRSGSIHGASGISKAFKNGNKVLNIPSSLSNYSEFIRSDENYKWIKWQIDGNTYSSISNNCPYCTNDIESKRDRIKEVEKTYDPKSIEKLNLIIGVFTRLKKYFSDETNEIIDSFIKNIDGYTEDQVDYLLEVKKQVDRLREKLQKIKNICFNSLKDVDRVIEDLNNYQIDLRLFNFLNSKITQQKVENINNSLIQVLGKAGELQGCINKQKKHIEELINENKNKINCFLKNAGFQYHVDILESEDGEYRLKLLHNDIDSEIESARKHLSFGERNAFSLVLFMFDAIKSDPDLIILDDPISSFDKNKKYAIVELLFKKEWAFRNKTVVMLTHDFQPIVDMMYHHTDRFVPCYAAFLENSNGTLSEKVIEKSDILTFLDINNENIEKSEYEVCKLIYLRRLFEINNNKGMGYQLISNLLHKRDIPRLNNPDDREMSSEEIKEGTEEINLKIKDFEYDRVLNLVKNDDYMKQVFQNVKNNYEKLHVFRVIFDDRPEESESSIFNKYINQTFHIENDYIYQLNPCKFQLIVSVTFLL